MLASRATNRLWNLLSTQAPDCLFVGQVCGVSTDDHTSYFVPDVIVVHNKALDRDGDSFQPSEVLLVVEVLSPSNSGVDVVLKRRYYAAAGIPSYWIVDGKTRTLTMLRLDSDSYQEEAVVRPGTMSQTDSPFAITLDPADFL
jgi:Uma2 family endonuclease